MSKDLLKEMQAYREELTAIRHDIHKHPETAFEENRTADIVAARLTEWGIPIHRGLGKTGVVGTLKGKRQGQRAIEAHQRDEERMPLHLARKRVDGHEWIGRFEIGSRREHHGIPGTRRGAARERDHSEHDGQGTRD